MIKKYNKIIKVVKFVLDALKHFFGESKESSVEIVEKFNKEVNNKITQEADNKIKEF